jgi:hypothetical protein
MDMLYLGLGGGMAVFLTALGWEAATRRWNTKESSSSSSSSFLPPDARVSLKPVLSDAQARFYNLLRLAVQDQYLIFAQVPLWCLLEVQVPYPKSRLPLLSQLALKRATFVLVHAGTLRAEKVVELQEEGDASTPRRERDDRLIEAVLGSAGIQLVRVSATDASDVPALASLLDVAGPE